MFVIVEWEPYPAWGFDQKNIAFRVTGSFDKMSLAVQYLEGWNFKLRSTNDNVWWRVGGEGGMCPDCAKIVELHEAILPNRE